LPFLAYVITPGPQSLDGYAFSYDVDAKAMHISRPDDEAPTSLGNFSATLDPNKDYRLVFQGFEGEFRGKVFALSAPGFPIGAITAFDSTYSSGPCGLFNAHGVLDGTGISDSTFDNYFSSPDTDVDGEGMTDRWEIDHFGELFWFDDEDFDGDRQTNLDEFIGGSDPTDPGSLSGIKEVTVAGGDITLTFPIIPGRTYGLETSPDMDTWTPRPTAVFANNGATGSLTFPTGGQSLFFGRVVATVD